MVGLLVITGSALVTGFGIYKYSTRREDDPEQKPAWKRWLQTRLRFMQGSQPNNDSRVQPREQIGAITEGRRETAETLRYGLDSSSISLVLASTGLLFFPPLHYASIPVLIYMGIPPAQEAYDILHIERRGSRALTETVVLAICLGSGYYLVGSLGFWLYYLRRTLGQKSDRRGQTVQPFSQTACLIKDAEEVTVSAATLQPGDTILVQSGELAPADGLITAGSAWLKSAALMNSAAEIFKQPGDRVSATDIVLVGRICVQVQKVE